MQESITNYKLLSLILFFFLVSAVYLSAEWVENNYYNIGNLFFDYDGNFIQIPDSSFAMYFSTNNLISVDISQSKIRGYFMFFHDIHSGTIAIVPDQISGWNMYYFDQERGYFGKLHITQNGEFGEDKWLERNSSIVSTPAVIPQYHEVYYFTEKISCLDADNETWTEYDYPRGWDTAYDYIELYPVLNANSIIGISYGNNVKEYQSIVFDIVTKQSKLINGESGVFSKIRDIKECKSHSGYLIMLKYKKIYSYDLSTGTVDLIMENGKINSKTIMQNESGNLYFIEEPNSLNILDLEEKRFETHEITLDDKLFMEELSGQYDSKRDKIICTIYNVPPEGLFPDNPRICIIDPVTFSLEYISDAMDRVYPNLFFEEKYKLLFSSAPKLYIADLNTHEIKNTIPIEYYSYPWKVNNDFEKTILLNNQYGSDFVRITPDFRREIINAGTNASIVCQFPDEKSCIVGDFTYLDLRSFFDYYNFGYFDFENGRFQDIDFLNSCDKIISDSINDQIIIIGYKEVHFINSDLSKTSWIVPGENDYVRFMSLFDKDNNIIWLICIDLITNDTNIFKLSAKMKSLIDSFFFQNKEITGIMNIVIDPSGNFLYLVTTTNKSTQRNLVIIDTNEKEIIKRSTLQTEVKNKTASSVVIPGIIPIPKKNKLFLWDHYSAWCIDTNSWEIEYGEVKNNPSAFQSVGMEYLNPHVKGEYISETNHIILLDYSVDKEGTGSDQYRCLEVDLATGSIVKELIKPENANNIQFSKDKKNIYFLDSNDSRINILHLDPAWDRPATITPGTNYIQFGEGDKAKFTINIKNDYDFSQDVTAYIWLYAPDGTMLFLDGISLTTNISGIPLTLPANLDITGDILAFTMPAGVPEGFYNFNAVLINENGDRGPVGTWNFYVKD